MLAIIFPGQGSQSVGMGSDFYDNFPIVRDIFEEITDETGIDIKEIINNNPENKLNITEYTQICIFSISISIFQTIKDLLGSNITEKIKFMAGHSLGEYSALAASESLSIKKCAKLLKSRGKFMQNSYPEYKSGMLAVMGMNINQVEEIMNMNEKSNFQIANDNGPQQVIISLNKKNFKNVTELLKKKGAKKVVPLNVSAAFHSSYMKNAEENLINEFKKLDFKDSKYPIISNFNAKPNQNSKEILHDLEKQITNRVRWTETINFLEKNKILHIIEVGPNKVLSGLSKRISNNFTFTNVSNIKELENLKNAI